MNVTNPNQTQTVSPAAIRDEDESDVCESNHREKVVSLVLPGSRQFSIDFCDKEDSKWSMGVKMERSEGSDGPLTLAVSLSCKWIPCGIRIRFRV